MSFAGHTSGVNLKMPDFGAVATQINVFGTFTPNLGEMIQFDDHIFQMGWFNHQLDNKANMSCKSIHGIFGGVGTKTTHRIYMYIYIHIFFYMNEFLFRVSMYLEDHPI